MKTCRELDLKSRFFSTWEQSPAIGGFSPGCKSFWDVSTCWNRKPKHFYNLCNHHFCLIGYAKSTYICNMQVADEKLPLWTSFFSSATFLLEYSHLNFSPPKSYCQMKTSQHIKYNITKVSGLVQKFDNLQYDTMARWVDGMIVPPSDGPMFILIDWE